MHEYSKKPKDSEEILRIAVEKAQQEMLRRGGPQLGETVAHPLDKIVYTFQKAEGDVAFVLLPAEFSKSGVEIQKQFPLKELFNPNDAMEFAMAENFPSQQKPHLN